MVTVKLNLHKGKQPQFSAKKHRHIKQKLLDLAHILFSTEVRAFVLPLAFLHERTYNPVQTEDKYELAENSPSKNVYFIL